MPLKVLAGLILCNLIWSLNPVMGKMVLLDFSPPQAAWLRFFFAWIGYLVFIFIYKRFKAPTRAFLISRRKSDWAFVIALGFMAFCFAPLTQILGLAGSHASENSLIIALEPLITVLLAWIFLRERPSLLLAICFLVALAGFGFLAGIVPGSAQGQGDGHLTGNLLIFLSLFGEASYSILARKLMDRRLNPIAIFGTAITFGVLCLTFALLVDSGPSGFNFFPHFTSRSLMGVLWLGPLGTTVTYVYWMIALGETVVAGLALTLFIQPVFGAFLGYQLLGDRLSMSQKLGASLILAAVFIFVGLAHYRSKKAEITRSI